MPLTFALTLIILALVMVLAMVSLVAFKSLTPRTACVCCTIYLVVLGGIWALVGGV